MTGTMRGSRRGFTLMEAIAALVVLGILIPPTIAMMRDAARSRVDAVKLTRATWLAAAVMEQVIADVNSEHPGPGALTDPAAYLTTPGTGLEARIADVTSLYASAGLGWSLSIGEPVSADGASTGDAGRDVYRMVLVRVEWEARGGERRFELGSLLTSLHQ